MKKRKIYIVGNWKQNFNISEGSLHMHRLQEEIKKHNNIEIVVCPSFVSIQPLQRQVDHRKFSIGAQNMHYEDHGPATGEVSGPMLRGLVKYVIIGHSYRRANYNETDQNVGKKVSSAIRNDIIPIICIGENATEKAAGHTSRVISQQLEAALAGVTSADIDKIVIASEPSWAISTNKGSRAPTDKEIVEPITLIRSIVDSRYGARASKSVPVLYGGSVDSTTVTDYLLLEGVDGFLIGSAALKHKEFAKIVERAHNISISNNS